MARGRAAETKSRRVDVLSPPPNVKQMATLALVDSEPDILAAWGQSFQILSKGEDPNGVFGTAQVRQLHASTCAR